ncbi:Holliday junction branch migration DNA helicase RuvB [Clostridiales bacterium COT073_COT-073]|nr:Holliday junction branch migration DNA helicase RuvB [Clostridiales bacterium COT073_COT-073]
MKDRIITGSLMEEDLGIDSSLRPKKIEDYIGQTKVKETMKVYIEAAKNRGESLDHVLLYGPPGLGKTTLAGIIAEEMNAPIRITSGPAIERPGDMAAILSSLKDGEILFIDEIHRMNRQVEEILYPGMEDYAIDILIGKGPSAKSIRIDLPKFTLVGATTRIGLLSSPLRDRFGVIQKLEYYETKDLQDIIIRSAGVFAVEIDPAGAKELALRSRGTPRIANRLLKRVRDFAEVKYQGVITGQVAKESLDILDVDPLGLDKNDRRLLLGMIEKYNGGPVGLETIAATIGEEADTVLEVYEPYLMQQGLLQRTPRGRKVTPFGYKHLGLSDEKYQHQLDLELTERIGF